MKLTANFNLSEFECNCGCKMPDHILKNVKLLAGSLQILRIFLNKPIKLTNYSLKLNQIAQLYTLIRIRCIKKSTLMYIKEQY